MAYENLIPPSFWQHEVECEPEPETIYCAGCSDTDVAYAGQVCLTCRGSEMSDWVTLDDYLAMRSAAAIEDARAIVITPAQALLLAEMSDQIQPEQMRRTA